MEIGASNKNQTLHYIGSKIFFASWIFESYGV